METKLNQSKTIFKTNLPGWMGLNLKPIDVNCKISFENWKEQHASLIKGENIALQEKEYLKYLKKRRRDSKMSPGTAASISLRYEKSLKTSKLSKSNTPFLNDLYRTAYASTDFMVSMIDAFESWCKQNSFKPNESSFTEFGTLVKEDLSISKEINMGIHKFSYNFYNLRDIQSLPLTPPNRDLNDNFSNLSWLINDNKINETKNK